MLLLVVIFFLKYTYMSLILDLPCSLFKTTSTYRLSRFVDTKLQRKYLLLCLGMFILCYQSQTCASKIILSSTEGKKFVKGSFFLFLQVSFSRTLLLIFVVSAIDSHQYHFLRENARRQILNLNISD